MIKLNKNDLNKILKAKNPEKKKYTTPMERMKNILSKYSYSDMDIAYYDENQFVIHLKNIRLLTNNDLLRIDSRKITPYKNMCKERIKNVVKKIDLKNWQEKTKDKKLKLEYIYAPDHNKKMDNIDGIMGAFKFLVDGLTISNIIKDDNEDIIPFAFPKQKKGNNEIVILLTIEENKDKYYSEKFKNFIKEIN